MGCYIKLGKIYKQEGAFEIDDYKDKMSKMLPNCGDKRSLSASIDSSDLLPPHKRAVITHSGNRQAHPSEIDNTILSNVLLCIYCYNYVHTQTCTQHTSSHTIIVYVVIWMIYM